MFTLYTVKFTNICKFITISDCDSLHERLRYAEESLKLKQSVSFSADRILEILELLENKSWGSTIDAIKSRIIKHK